MKWVVQVRFDLEFIGVTTVFVVLMLAMMGCPFIELFSNLVDYVKWRLNGE